MSGRIRTVKPEWLDDEKLAACSDAARTLSIGLVLLSDDHGRGRAHPLFLASRAWAYGDPHETLTKLERALSELVAIGFVGLYQVGGQRYFFLRNWTKHQKVQHPSAPRVPAPEQADEDGPEGGGSVPQAAPASPSLTPASGASHEALTPDLDLDQDQDPDQDHTYVAPGGAPAPVDRIFDRWRVVMGKPRAKLDPKRRRLIATRMREHDEATLIAAIEGCARSDWHMGRDAKSEGRANNGLELILRDAAHIERFAEMPSRATTGGYAPPSTNHENITDEEIASYGG